MWKYRCKTYLIALLASFLGGCLFSYFAYQDTNTIQYLLSMVPSELAGEVLRYPWLLYVSGGLFAGGIANVFVLGNLAMTIWGISPFIMILMAMFFPTVFIYLGILLWPVSVLVTLYGWLSLRTHRANILKKRNIANEDELVRIYLIHHTLEEKYRELGENARRISRRVSEVYALGIIALITVFLFVDNLFLSFGMILLFFFAYQFLVRYKASALFPISQLLYEKCDPQACMSALLFYCQRGKHYKLTNQPLMAQCLIFMDDPSLAQDILATYPRPTGHSELTYWSLMASIYYELADEQGLTRCLEEVSKAKLSFGRMSVFIKSEEKNAIQNKIRLMNGDFSSCKQYYLERLKTARTNLEKADDNYYIALISFVQKDYSLAALYFEKAIQLGNKLYFVPKAEHYLETIQAAQKDEDDSQQ